MPAAVLADVGELALAERPVPALDRPRDELTVLGGYVGQDVFPTAIRLLERGRIDFAPLVTHRIGLEELPAAIAELRGGRAVKVSVEF